MADKVSLVIGFILMVLWVAYLFEGRRIMNERERLPSAFILQWNILPLLVAIELFATRNPVVAVAGLLFFFLCWPFARMLMLIVPFVIGWHVGVEIFGGGALTTAHAAFAGLVVAVVLTCCSMLIHASMTLRPRHT